MSEQPSDPADDIGHSIFTHLRPHPQAAEDETAPNSGVAAVADPPAKPGRGDARSSDEARLRSGFKPSSGHLDDAGAAPDWLPESDLERAAPNAVKLLARVWGTPAAVNALRALVFDGHGLVRRWPPAAWAELSLLCRVHADEHPSEAGVHGEPVPDVSALPLLETGYRHVVERLLRSWGYVDAYAVVCRDLFFDERRGRKGWPVEVWEDLVMLQQLHERVYGSLSAEAEPWKDFKITG